MPHPERQVREYFNSQINTIVIGGTAVARLVGCVYALLDTDGEPLYVGRSVSEGESLGVRVGRHVLGQRSDAANKVFPPFETRTLRLWPMRTPSGLTSPLQDEERDLVRVAESQVFNLLCATATHPPLNERRPSAPDQLVPLPPHLDVDFWPADVVPILGDIDGRVDRWAETMRRLAERVKHSGQTRGLRVVQRLQADRFRALLG